MERNDNIRIVDIAKMANVSVGTVDRILHNRGRVSDEKRIRVEEVLERINYKPNMVARFLASKRNLSFAVIIPSYQQGEYWELVSCGINQAAKDLEDFHISVSYLYFDQFDDSALTSIIDSIEQQNFSGAIIATLLKESVIELSTKLDSIDIPYIFIDSNIPDCNNISYFGVDSFASGVVAAKIILNNLTPADTILIAHPKYARQSKSTQIENREIGFKAYLKEQHFTGEVISFDFDLKEKEKYTKQLTDILKRINGHMAITVFNSRIYEVISLIDELDDKYKIQRITGFDPIAKNVEALKSNKITHLISQRSVKQGYDSVKTLSNFLIFNTKTSKLNYMPIDILIKENVDYYND